MKVIILRRKYMKKGHGVLEIALILCFVAAISFAAISIYNNQKNILVFMSKPTVPVNVNTIDANKAQETVINSPYNKIETAGTNALIRLGMDSPKEFETAMAKVNYGKLQSLATGRDEDDIFKLANALNDALGLGFADVSSEKVTPETLSIFTKILDAAVALPDSSSFKSTANAYIAQFKLLLGLS